MNFKERAAIFQGTIKMSPNSVDRPPEVSSEESAQEDSGRTKHRTQVVWFNAAVYVFLHVSFFYAIYLSATSSQLKTVIFAYIYANLGNLGITAGSHRLWSHRSYKARLPLRAFLCVLCSIAAQNDIFVWCRDHRVHHKFTETDADPHNINRGFFFAHVGWLLSKKHPQVAEKGKTLDLDDLLADPVIRFHRRFYLPMVLVFNLVLPTLVPWLFWNETFWNSFFIATVGRYCYSLNVTWLVNSAAHYYGNQPYDKYIEARENPFVSFFAIGEGWHNYHHVFPWDYTTSELGYTLNFTRAFIDLMAYFGQAYDLKQASGHMVRSKMTKHGDGTRMANGREVADHKEE